MDEQKSENARNVIWEEAYGLHYDALYAELLNDRMLYIWSMIDVVSRVLIAATASGSAIAGFSLWEQPGYKEVWVAVAGTSAILALMHPILKVSEHVTNLAELKLFFASLRNDLEGFQAHMRIDPDFEVAMFHAKLDDFRKRFGDGIQRRDHDILQSRRIEIQIQEEVNRRLAADV